MPKVVAYQASAEESVASIRAKITNVEAKKEKLIEDMISGLLDRSEYDFMNSRLQLQLIQLQHDYYAAKQSSEELEQLNATTKSWINALKEYKSIKNIDRGLVEALVDKIVVYDSTHIQIKMAFANPFTAINGYVDKIEEVMKDAG